MRLPVLTIHDVVDRQLCSGCGACEFLNPTEVRMVDVPEFGRRPAVTRSDGNGGGRDNELCACPGAELGHAGNGDRDGMIAELYAGWGPVLGVWEGHANDKEIRLSGSSGGAASALALFCLEREGMHGVLHTSARADVPYLNETVLSKGRDELLSRTGSRYSPASPCEGLGRIEEAEGPCVFIGKPCDVAAASMARKVRPKLDENIGLLLAFFCAGTPSTQGTLDLLSRMGVADPDSVSQLRFRGNGWPGKWTVRYSESDVERTQELSYEESWGFLQKYRQWRCHICPDHTGEFADIAVGDPWHRDRNDDQVGRSLILARTERGRRIIEEAAKAGYVTVEAVAAGALPASQPNLLMSRGALWGRLLSLRMARVPVPRYSGFEMFRFWRRSLSLKQKVQSFVGTWRRIRRRGLYRRVRVEAICEGAREFTEEKGA